MLLYDVKSHVQSIAHQSDIKTKYDSVKKYITKQTDMHPK